jgi:hypothetical protein
MYSILETAKTDKFRIEDVRAALIWFIVVSVAFLKLK